MKPTDFKALVAKRFQAGIKRPLHVESSPGLGKTAMPEQVAAELKIGFMAIHAPLLQPEEYGFPVISADRKDVDFIVSRHKFPIEGSDCPESGIFLIDELSQADNNAQKILANVVQAREIHGRKIKAKWSIVTTGNRVADRSGANRILGHLADRVTRVELEASLDDWTNWALTNGVKTEVIAFIRFRPNLLSEYDPQADKSPTPRGWVEGVSTALGVVDPAHEFDCFKGDIGEGAAAEFLGFLKIYRKLPSPDTIILNPSKAEVPKDPATLYALCGALSHRTTKDNFTRVMEYISRLPSEFGVLFIRDTIVRAPDLQTTQDFIKWASGPGAKLLT